MIIIALDLGCDTGVAVGNDKGELSLSGVKKFKNTGKNPATGYPSETRFRAFYDWLNDIVADIISTTKEPILLAVEKTNTHMPGYDAVKLHFGLQAVIYLIQSDMSSVMEVKHVPALTIKKYWLGSAKLRGKESKAAMVKKTQEKYPEVTDHNEADAVALFHYAQENLYA